jgi:hypothetical protein
MPRTLTAALILFIPLAWANAQGLYMPRDVRQAFRKETRSLDGKPGKNYWQNTARYSINLVVAPPDRNIRGTEEITYYNNSPDTLHNPVFRLFLNVHRPGALRYFDASEGYLTSGMQVDAMSCNGQNLPWKDPNSHSTWQSIAVPKPIMPKDTVHFTFTWHYQVSKESGREGMIDSTTYYLAYFYPRVAVFDDIDGWDRMDFPDATEFYSDFNDYTVNVQVPANFVVWGTGTLQHPEQLLLPDILKRFQASLQSDQTVHVATFQEMTEKRITAQHPVNSWQFRAAAVPDMAFGLSDHYDWDAASVLVDDETHRRASVQSAFNDTAKDFHYMVQFGRHALDWFSHHLPGVAYPYEKSTIFQGYAGMEYPMMVNDETYQDTSFSLLVAEHEIAHTYMPFYMGIDETRYGFMDEGWATTFELLIGRSDVGVNRAEELYRQFRIAGWINDPAPYEDLPIITPGDALTGPGLGNLEYGKPSLAYLATKDLLGDDLFKTCLQQYMIRWHGKHPLPWDFFNCFSNVSGMNLDWFWKNWFFSSNYIDLGIDQVAPVPGGYKILVRNIGGFASPFDLVLHFQDGSSKSFHQTPAVWKVNPDSAEVQVAAGTGLQSVQVQGGIFMDADPGNNTWKPK